MKTWGLVAAAVAIAIFWGMLSIIFESVVFRLRTGWNFLPWWFCDVFATIGGVATFIFIYSRVAKR